MQYFIFDKNVFFLYTCSIIFHVLYRKHKNSINIFQLHAYRDEENEYLFYCVIWKFEFLFLKIILHYKTYLSNFSRCSSNFRLDTNKYICFTSDFFDIALLFR